MDTRFLQANNLLWGNPVVVDTTAAQTGPFYAIKAIDGTAVFTTLTFTNGAVLSADRILEGDYLLGNIASFTLTSGKVIAYRVGV